MISLGRMVGTSGLLGLALGMLPAASSWAVPQPVLSAQQREALRYRLENSFNEVDLLIRNQKVDRSDIERQRREAEIIQLYERIPFKENLEGLKKELTDTAKTFDIRLVDLKVMARSKAPAPIPKKVYSDSARYELKQEQVADTLQIQAMMEGSASQVKKWVESWPELQVRLVEPVGGYKDFKPAPAGKNGKHWFVNAKTFRFREIQFPKIEARDPIRQLPRWAQEKPQSFAKSEPVLWNLIEKSRTLSPQAQPLYDAKREFLLNAARMEFFMAKTQAQGTPDPASHRHSH